MSEKEMKKDNSKWIQLPDEILELIMKRLTLRDYLALRSICSPWRRTVNNAIANKHCFPLPELPLIVLKSKEIILFNLRTEREHCPKLSIFESPKSIYGSVEGWMIMSEYIKNDSLLIFFFNPVTNRRVSVPSPLYFPSKSPIQAGKLCIKKMVASSAPDCYKSGCYLAGLFNNLCHIAFYRPFDKSWNMIGEERNGEDRDPEVLFSDLEIMGSKLYVCTAKPLRSISVYDLKNSADGLPKPKVLVIRPQRLTPYESRITGNQRHVSGNAYFFLAKHETLEQLFLTYVINNVIYKREHVDNIVKEFVTSLEITAVEVFKLDMNKEPIEWIKCESLDNNAIFVSCSKSIVMSRASLNSTQESTIRENSVYFALHLKCHTNPWKDVQLGIKHLSDGNIKYFSVEQSNYSKVPYFTWFVPSI